MSFDFEKAEKEIAKQLESQIHSLFKEHYERFKEGPDDQGDDDKLVALMLSVLNTSINISTMSSFKLLRMYDEHQKNKNEL